MVLNLMYLETVTVPAAVLDMPAQVPDQLPGQSKPRFLPALTRKTRFYICGKYVAKDQKAKVDATITAGKRLLGEQ
jgi:hypothetical protein